MGLGAAFTFAVLSVFNRKLGASHPSGVISFYQFVVATVVLLPTLIWSHPASLTEPRTIALLLLLGTACTALAHTMFISGMRHISTMLASLFASLEPVWGIAFAVVLLGELPTTRSVFGGLLIVGASAVAGIRS
jgi:drug/metabolite transporter (DMT)-like permease